jgi:CBS domain-containing protein
VHEDATVADAAQALAGAAVPAVAVLDAGRHVRGLFTERDLLAALVPAYLRELRHTAFAEDDVRTLSRRAREMSVEPVAPHVTRAEVVDADSSLTHAAERLLHGRCAALPVVRDGRFAGILTRLELAQLLLGVAEPE